MQNDGADQREETPNGRCKPQKERNEAWATSRLGRRVLSCKVSGFARARLAHLLAGSWVCCETPEHASGA